MKFIHAHHVLVRSCSSLNGWTLNSKTLKTLSWNCNCNCTIMQKWLGWRKVRQQGASWFEDAVEFRVECWGHSCLRWRWARLLARLTFQTHEQKSLQPQTVLLLPMPDQGISCITSWPHEARSECSSAQYDNLTSKFGAGYKKLGFLRSLISCVFLQGNPFQNLAGNLKENQVTDNEV